MKLIAILPFTISGDSDSELAAVAIDEALHNVLTASHINILLETTYSYPLNAASAGQAARLLGAQLFITGIVQNKGDQTYAQLAITNAVGETLFKTAAKFQRSDVLALVDAIAKQVAGVLGISAETSPHVYRPFRRDAYAMYINALSVVRKAKSVDDLKKAAALYSTALTLEPDCACTHAGLAEAELRIFQMTHNGITLSDSSRATAQASSAHSSCVSAKYRAAFLMNATGQTISSLSVLKPISDQLPDSAQLKRDIAHVFLKLGMYREAVSEAVKATAIDSKFWLNQEVLGECYVAEGSYTKAIATFAYVVALKSDSSIAYHNLGASYLYNGAFERAIDPLQRAIRIKPIAATYSNLGTAYLYMGNAPASVTEYKRASSLDPKSEEYAGNLATAYGLTGRSDAARTWFLRALVLARQDLAHGRDISRREAHIALYEAQLGHVQTSYRMIAAARNLDPRSADVLCAEIVIEALANDYNKAIESASTFFALGFPKQLIEANPNLSALRRNRQFMELTKNSMSPQ